MLFGWLSFILVIVWIRLLYHAIQWRNQIWQESTIGGSQLWVAHTIGVVDGLLGFYTIPQELTIEEVNALMTDIEKITARLRQLSRLLVFIAQKDHNMMTAQIAEDRRKPALEEAQGIITREMDRIAEYTPPDHP